MHQHQLSTHSSSALKKQTFLRPRLQPKIQAHIKYCGSALLMTLLTCCPLSGLADVNPAVGAHLHNSNTTASTKATQPPVKHIWNLQNADIRAVIDTVAKVTGRNFIVDPRVGGKMTIVSSKPMDNQQFYQAFLSMLQVLNYAIVPSGDQQHTYEQIVPAQDAKEMGAPFISNSARFHVPVDQVVVRMVPIIHTSAQQLTSILRPLMQDSDSINAYAPSNSLILAGAAGNIDKLITMIHKLDIEHSSRVVFIPLKHADASNIVTILRTLQDTDRAQGKVSNIAFAADSNSNTVLMSGNIENIQDSEHLIKRLDAANTSASANVIKLNYLDAKKFAPVLQKLVTAAQGQSSSQTKVAIEAQEDQNALIVEAPAAAVLQVRGLVAKLDHRPGQVLVQAIIARVDSTLLNHLGILWGQTQGAGVDPETGNVSVGTISPSSMGQAGYVFDGSKLEPLGPFGALLEALKSNQNTSILSNPSVMVLNNQKANITEGKTIRVLDQQNSSPTAQMDDGIGTTSNYADKKVNLTLEVKPQISPNNTLQLAIKQTNDTLEGTQDDVTGQPVIDTQSISTNVMVNSGEILVLGGLVSNETIHDSKKIPILGSIPILGHLFRYKSKELDKRNLMVFIRTKILHGHADTRHASLQRYRFMQQQQIASETGGSMDLNRSTVLPRDSRQALAALPNPFSEQSAALPSRSTERRRAAYHTTKKSSLEDSATSH